MIIRQIVVEEEDILQDYIQKKLSEGFTLHQVKSKLNVSGIQNKIIF